MKDILTRRQRRDEGLGLTHRLALPSVESKHVPPSMKCSTAVETFLSWTSMRVVSRVLRGGDMIRWDVEPVSGIHGWAYNHVPVFSVPLRSGMKLLETLDLERCPHCGISKPLLARNHLIDVIDAVYGVKEEVAHISVLSLCWRRLSVGTGKGSR